MNTLYKKLPGHVLVEDFIAPYYPADLYELSKRAKISHRRLQDLIRGKDRIDPGMAKKLGDFFQNGSDFWLSLQERFERGETL
jgi:addiction module HigA family antidote